MNIELLTQSIATGIMLGGLYAIIGLGLSLIFGIMGLTNIAHGNLMILSAFFIIVFSQMFGGSILVALALTAVVMIILGFLFQKFLVNRVIDLGPNPALLVTFGVSIIIQNSLNQIFGADSQSIKSAFSATNVLSTKYVTISGSYLLNFIVAVVVIIGLSVFIKKSPIGRAIRAASDSARAAELMGVNTKMIYAIAMGISMVTACIAGLLVGNTFVFYSYSGPQYLIIAFGVVVIGGMGSLVGTLLGGIILGLAQLLGSYFVGTGYQIFVGYMVMLVLLTLKPAGLLSNMTRK